MAIDSATRDQIIVAAVTGAGPVGDNAEEWEVSVLRGARKITAVLSDPESIFAKAVEEIDGAGKFVSLVSLVKKEKSSTRGIVYIQDVPRIEGNVVPVPRYTYEQISAIHVEQTAARTAGNKPDPRPDGLEAIRTERTDTLDGLTMAKEATSLIGHRVLIYKVQEVAKNNPNLKVRVLRHVTDLGRYESFVIPTPAVVAAPSA